MPASCARRKSNHTPSVPRLADVRMRAPDAPDAPIGVARSFDRVDASASRDAILARSRARDAARASARVANRRTKILSTTSTHLGGVEDVRVVRALDRLRPFRGFERDLEVRDRGSARDGGGGSARAREGRDGGGGDGHLHDGGHCVCVLLRGVVSTRAIDARIDEVGRATSPSRGGSASSQDSRRVFDRSRRARLDRRANRSRFAVRPRAVDRRATRRSIAARAPHTATMRATTTTTRTARATCSTSVAGAARRRPTTRRPDARARAARAIDRRRRRRTANDSSTSSRAAPRLDPFGFGARRRDAPDEIKPGFDTAEGGKVGPGGDVSHLRAADRAVRGVVFFHERAARDGGGARGEAVGGRSERADAELREAVRR